MRQDEKTAANEDGGLGPDVMFDYRTVDVPMHNGHPALDSTVSLMEQEGWRPLALIPPNGNFPHNSIVFEKEVNYV